MSVIDSYRQSELTPRDMFKTTPANSVALMAGSAGVVLVAKNDGQVVGVKAEHVTDVIAIVSVVTAVVVAVMVIVPVVPVSGMTVGMFTMVLPVVMSIFVSVFVTLPVAVSVAVFTVMAVITVPVASVSLVVGFAPILLILVMPVPVAVPGVYDQW